MRSSPNASDYVSLHTIEDASDTGAGEPVGLILPPSEDHAPLLQISTASGISVRGLPLGVSNSRGRPAGAALRGTILEDQEAKAAMWDCAIRSVHHKVYLICYMYFYLKFPLVIRYVVYVFLYYLVTFAAIQQLSQVVSPCWRRFIGLQQSLTGYTASNRP